MTGEELLHKTNRINMLFDLYGPLLTDRQRTFLGLYVRDDHSLGEIAEEFAVSRQAVFEHIKRAEQVLEDYESKLRLAARHQERRLIAERIERMFGGPSWAGSDELKQAVRQLYDID